MNIENLPVSIPDSNFYEGLKEIHDYLVLAHKRFDTHAMSDHALFLQGEKEMLGKVIVYLQRVIG